MLLQSLFSGEDIYVYVTSIFMSVSLSSYMCYITLVCTLCLVAGKVGKKTTLLVLVNYIVYFN